MTTDFIVISGTTVPKNYTWDIGEPLTTTPTRTRATTTTIPSGFFQQENTTTTSITGTVPGTTITYTPQTTEGVFRTETVFITGYAPGLKVLFQPIVQNPPQTTTTIEQTQTVESVYVWNFGDYYNETNNSLTLTCLSPVEHLYIMPGTYVVQFDNIQTVQITPNPLLISKCYGKEKIGWFWDNFACDKQNALTWDAAQERCGTLGGKTWSDETRCFEEYCKYWYWKALECEDKDGINPVRWFETAQDGVFKKRWLKEPNQTLCTEEIIETANAIRQTVIKAVVIVKEIEPQANLVTVTSSVTGISPHTIQLSPKLCIPGSFPIDKIVWDFGDGSPLETVTRYTTPNKDKFINTSTFFDDINDPRNFDATHTYNRTDTNFAMFYPSLTCYSANTSTADSCSIVIGPIVYPNIKTVPDLIKIKNTDKGILYGLSYDENVSLFTNYSLPKTIKIIPKPSSHLKQTLLTSLYYYGYNGQNYPQTFSQSCENLLVPETPLKPLSQENSIENLILLEDDTLLYI